MRRRLIERIATIGVAVICFLGSTLFGGGPFPILVNGPYIVGAHERSQGSPSLALANWVSTHLPAGSHVAVDRDNAGLLNYFGQVDPVFPLNGSDNPASLFFDQQLTPSDISLIRKDHIRYIVTDTRLTKGLPLFGAYIAPGETGHPTRLTAAELEKFNSTRGVHRIYDNGAIQVYDLSLLLGERPLVVPRDSVRRINATGTDIVVLVLAILVATVWLLRLRRRARLVPIDEHMVVCGIVGALAIGLFWAFAILLIHLPPGPIAILSLVVLMALGLRRAARRTLPELPRHGDQLAQVLDPKSGSPAPSGGCGVRSTGNRRAPALSSSDMVTHDTDGLGTDMFMQGFADHPEARIVGGGSVPESPGQSPGRAHRVRSQFVLGCVGLALFAFGASFAVAAAQKEWVPPPELSIEVEQGQPVVSVDLGTSAPIPAHLEVVTR